MVEDSAGLRWVKNYPEVGIIASSKSIYEYIKEKLPNKVVLIPQHHCNFDREVVDKVQLDTVGIIGNQASFQYPIEEFKRRINNMGLELKTLIKKRFNNRQEVVDFYEQIDLQVIWRPESDGVLRNPLKLVNAMSYGIPTIAYPETNFVAELQEYFLPAKTIEGLINGVKWFRDNLRFYQSWRKNVVEKAEDYHIDNISKLYLKL